MKFAILKRESQYLLRKQFKNVPDEWEMKNLNLLFIIQSSIFFENFQSLED